MHITRSRIGRKRNEGNRGLEKTNRGREEKKRKKKHESRWQQKRQGRRRIDRYHLLTGMDVSRLRAMMERGRGWVIRIGHIHPMDRAVRWIKETQPLWIMESTRFNEPHPSLSSLVAFVSGISPSNSFQPPLTPVPLPPILFDDRSTKYRMGNGIFPTLKIYRWL